MRHPTQGARFLPGPGAAAGAGCCAAVAVLLLLIAALAPSQAEAQVRQRGAAVRAAPAAERPARLAPPAWHRQATAPTHSFQQWPDVSASRGLGVPMTRSHPFLRRSHDGWPTARGPHRGKRGAPAVGWWWHPAWRVWHLAPYGAYEAFAVHGGFAAYGALIAHGTFATHRAYGAGGDTRADGGHPDAEISGCALVRLASSAGEYAMAVRLPVYGAHTAEGLGEILAARLAEGRTAHLVGIDGVSISVPAGPEMRLLEVAPC